MTRLLAIATMATGLVLGGGLIAPESNNAEAQIRVYSCSDSPYHGSYGRSYGNRYYGNQYGYGNSYYGNRSYGNSYYGRSYSNPYYGGYGRGGYGYGGYGRSGFSYQSGNFGIYVR